MAKLTERDIDIFKVSSLGVANFKMLMILLNETYGYAITEQALLQRLSILHRAHYIAARKEPYRKRPGNFTIYALTDRAADVLAELGHQIETIRVGLPKHFFVRHEMKITLVLHTVHIESSKGHYNYSFMDSNVLKQSRTKKSKTPIPDLDLIVELKNRVIDLHVEVDLGKVLICKMVHRIAEQAKKGWLLLIMCNNKLRLQNLRKACCQSNFYGMENVLFVLLEDFFKGGFLHTGLRTVTDKTVWLQLDDE